MANQFDVAVIGGGPVGWACALACVSAHPRASVAVVERSDAPVLPQGQFGTRVYTVTNDNVAWLEVLGVHLDDSRTSTVEAIRVFSASGAQALTVNLQDAKRERLAKVVEHDALSAAIAARAKALGVRFVRGEAKTTGQIGGQRYVEINEDQLVSAKLVVVADGVHSTLRQALGIHVLQRDYERVGVVAHFAIAEPHRFEARQWFLPDQSILALLPLPDAVAGDVALTARPAVSMVWSTTAAHAQSLAAMSESAICEAVSNATRYAVLAEARLTPCATFALRLLRAADPTAARALVVGDAAHAIHPLAGQGVNLGLGDARCFAETLQCADQTHGDLGHTLLLAKFRRSRYAAVLSMQAATDGLARIYNLNTSYLANSPTALATVGTLGMRVLGKLPAFRRLVSSAAS